MRIYKIRGLDLEGKGKHKDEAIIPEIFLSHILTELGGCTDIQCIGHMPDNFIANEYNPIKFKNRVEKVINE